MKQAFDEIANLWCPEPRIWKLGKSGFAFKQHEIVFFADPDFEYAEPMPAADLVLLTHVDDAAPRAAVRILEESPRAKAIVPKSRASVLEAAGVPLHRMTTTDSDLRVEFFKAGYYGRVYSTPSARKGDLEWTPIGGYPRLGYLIRFGACTIYYAGVCTPYEGLVARLKPYNVTVALLPLGPENFEVAQAAQLAHDMGARWVTPMNCDSAEAAHFTMHMLGHRPSQRFKIFETGEGWNIPAEDENAEAEDRVS